MILGPERQQLTVPPGAGRSAPPTGGAAPAAKPRTAAQREASRRNGAKSRGPTSAAGKTRVRANGLRHGLRAEKLGPPADARGLDHDYKRTVRALVEEFGPTSFTQLQTISSLARDYLRLHTADRMLDAAATPGVFGAREHKEQYQMHRRARRLERQAADALVALRSGEPADLMLRAADQLAGHIANLVEQVEAEWADAKEQFAELVQFESQGEFAHDDVEEIAELRQLKVLADAIRPRRRVLRDMERVSKAFRGARTVHGVEHRALVLLLTDIHHNARSSVIGTQHMLRVLREAAEAHLARLAGDPGQLQLLEQYRRQIERTIAGKIRALRAAGG